MSPRITIELLADRPEALPRLIALFETEWSGWYGAGRHSARTDLKARLQRDALPLGIVALIDGEAVGTAALTETSGGIARPPLPWLGGLLVDPAHRRKGVARALLRRARDEAARLDHARLLALTTHADPLFVTEGWQVIETVTLGDGPHRIYEALAL
jgi:GNAT superfamily N-acetyltransferase